MTPYPNERVALFIDGANLYSAAKALNPSITILSRARYVAEQQALETLGVDAAVYEEAEAAVGLATLLLEQVGAPAERVHAETERLRARFAVARPKADIESLPTTPPPGTGDEDAAYGS